MWKKQKLVKAAEIFKKAISRDKRCVQAILCLADLRVEEGSLDEAIEMLESQSVQNNSSDTLYTRVGEIYAMKKDYVAAMDCFSTALS